MFIHRFMRVGSCVSKRRCESDCWSVVRMHKSNCQFFFLSSFFLLSMRVSSIYLPHCLRRCVRMSSQVVCYSAPDVLDVLFDIGGVF